MKSKPERPAAASWQAHFTECFTCKEQRCCEEGAKLLRAALDEMSESQRGARV